MNCLVGQIDPERLSSGGDYDFVGNEVDLDASAGCNVVLMSTVHRGCSLPAIGAW